MLKEYDGGMHSQGMMGQPQYLGMEYGPESPDNMIISSPGGVSSTMHHYTNGFYGQGGSSADLYAGEGKTYPYGIYGGMYMSGSMAARQMGMYPPEIDTQFGKHYTSQPPVSDAFEIIPQPDSPTSLVEGFDGVTPAGNASGTTPMKAKIGLLTLFIIILVAYVTFELWTEAGLDFLSSYFYGGQPLGWKVMTLGAVIGTALLAFIIWISHAPEKDLCL